MPADTAPPSAAAIDTAPEAERRPADAAPALYHTRQLVAHWVIVMLVAMQFLLNDGMVRAFTAGEEAGRLVIAGGVITHATSGSVILLVMLYRLWLRRHHGAPPPPSSLPRWLQIASRANHYAFYVLLIGMPLLGATALLTLWGWVGTLHSLSASLLAVLIVAHLAGAFWHATKRDGTLVRILQPDPAHRPRAGVTPEA